MLAYFDSESQKLTPDRVRAQRDRRVLISAASIRLRRSNHFFLRCIWFIPALAMDVIVSNKGGDFLTGVEDQLLLLRLVVKPMACCGNRSKPPNLNAPVAIRMPSCFLTFTCLKDGLRDCGYIYIEKQIMQTVAGDYVSTWLGGCLYRHPTVSSLQCGPILVGPNGPKHCLFLASPHPNLNLQESIAWIHVL